MSDVSVVVVTYNGLPWLEQALESVRGHETVVVDHGSSDGTVPFVREQFPEVAVVEQENRGLAYGWNAGIESCTRRPAGTGSRALPGCAPVRPRLPSRS